MSVLHVLNGTMQWNEFKVMNRMKPNEVYVSFNEAMCVGEAEPDLFFESFIQTRIKALKTTPEDYHHIVLKPISPLFTTTFDEVRLYFDEDMFCQLNQLTVLAFLEQIGFQGAIFLNDQKLNERGALAYYHQLVCQRKLPHQEQPFCKKEATIRYLTYSTEAGEIKTYIRLYKDTKKEDLVLELLRQFECYGLGDVQYATLIEEVRKK